MRYCRVVRPLISSWEPAKMAERLVPLSVRPARRYASEIVTGADHLGTQA